MFYFCGTVFLKHFPLFYGFCRYADGHNFFKNNRQFYTAPTPAICDDE